MMQWRCIIKRYSELPTIVALGKHCVSPFGFCHIPVIVVLNRIHLLQLTGRKWPNSPKKPGSILHFPARWAWGFTSHLFPTPGQSRVRHCAGGLGRWTCWTPMDYTKPVAMNSGKIILEKVFAPHNLHKVCLSTIHWLLTKCAQFARMCAIQPKAKKSSFRRFTAVNYMHDHVAHSHVHKQRNNIFLQPRGNFAQPSAKPERFNNVQTRTFFRERRANLANARSQLRRVSVYGHCSRKEKSSTIRAGCYSSLPTTLVQGPRMFPAFDWKWSVVRTIIPSLCKMCLSQPPDFLPSPEGKPHDQACDVPTTTYAVNYAYSHDEQPWNPLDFPSSVGQQGISSVADGTPFNMCGKSLKRRTDGEATRGFLLQQSWRGPVQPELLISKHFDIWGFAIMLDAD